MSKFDVNPPLKQEVVEVPEWAEAFGEVVISEVSGLQGQELLDLFKEYQNPETGAKDEPLYNARLVSMSCTVGGERPPVEWLQRAPIRTLSMLANRVLTVNGFSAEAQEKIEKN